MGALNNLISSKSYFFILLEKIKRNLSREMSRSGANERLLEQENNRLSDQLARKISSLKQISIEMKVLKIEI